MVTEVLTPHLSRSTVRQVAPQQLTQETTPMLFSQVAADWLSSKIFPSLERLHPGRERHCYIRAKTLKGYTENVRELGRFFANMDVDAIRREDIRKYQQYRATPTDERRGTGPNKIEKELAALCWILTSAGKWTEDLDKYERLKLEDPEIPQALSPAEQARLLEAGKSAEHELMYCYAIVVLETTASEYEMRGLRIGDVDRGDGMIYVRWGKRKMRARSIPLHAEYDKQGHLVPGCGQWAMAKLLARARALGSWARTHYLFPFRVKRNLYDPQREISDSGFRRPWNELRRAAGVPWFQLNALRHTALTRYAETGTAMETMMRLAGHIDPRMTRHYTQVSEDAMRKAQQQVTVIQKRPPAPAKGPEPWAYAL